MTAFVICDLVCVKVVNAIVVVASATVDVLVEALKGGRCGAVDAVVEADGLLKKYSAAAVAASDVGIISTFCNMNGSTNAR